MKNLSIESKSWVVSIAATFTIIALVVFGLSAVERFNQINDQWKTHNEKSTTANQALARLRGGIGYGGFIHNFKNYVLRRSATYKNRVENDIEHIDRLLKQYRKIVTSETQHSALRSIEVVLANYFDKFLLVSRMIAEGRSSIDIDAAVKIDDKPALEAFDKLIVLAATQSQAMAARTDAELRSAVRFLSLGALLVILVAGVAILLIGFIRKITHFNIKLQTANNHVNLLFDTAPDPMICVRPDGVIVKSNVQAELLFGYTKSEFSGMSIENLMPESFREMHRRDRTNYFQAPRHRPIGMGLNLIALTKDGRQPQVEISLSHSCADEDPLATVTVRDTTEREKMQTQMEQSARLASLGEMATGTAHEINQPLNIIRMATDTLTERLAEGEVPRLDILKERLERISSQVERATGIIDRMRVFGRAPAERATRISLGDAALGAVDFLREEFRLHGIELDLDIPKICRPVMGDLIQLEQVILNLLSNARDAIQDESGTTIEGDNPDRVTMSIEDDFATDGIRLIVEDTGGGISRDVLPKIFNPFMTTKEVGKGTGLGLSISYGIVTEMGGTIIAVNVNGGARFTVDLPVVDEIRKQA